MGNGIPITCTTTYQKWTGQPITSAGSKNPLPLGMGSVNTSTKPHKSLYCSIQFSTKNRTCYEDLQGFLSRERHSVKTF